MGQRAHHARKQDGRRGLPRTDPETLRARAHRRDAARERRLHRFVCRQPLHGTRDTDLHLGLRAGGIRHRSDHGRAGARFARLCLRPSFRTGNHARRRRRRHQQGILRRQGGQTHQLRFSGRHGGQGGDRKDVRRHRAARTGQTAGQLPAARRHLLAPALSWGEPFPIYYRDEIARPLPESALPLELPPVSDFGPTEEGEPPLARAAGWTTADGDPLELSTMPGFAGSSAYYLRYMDPHNDRALVGREADEYWRSSSTSTWAASNMRRAT